MGKKVILLMVSMMLLVAILTIPEHTNCPSPIILGNKDRVESVVAGLVNDVGGLPKEGVNLPISSLSSARVHHVDDWEIEALTVGNTGTLWSSIRDDDPIYSSTIDLRASYTDGGERQLRWSSWRYGIVVCPFVFPLGDGSSGELSIIH